MKRSWFLVPAILPAAVALAQNGSILYNPVRSIVDQEIKVKGWGSGSVSETDEAAYEGTHSLRVSSRNFFQGGIIALGKPVDLDAEAGDKSNLLRIVFRTADITLGGGGGGVPGAGGKGGPAGAGGFGGGGGGRGAGGAGGLGAPGGPPGGAGGFGGGGGRGAGGQGAPGGLGGGGGFPGAGGKGGAGGFGGFGGGQGTAAPATGMKFIRLIVTTTDGKKSEAYIPTNSSVGTDEKGWRAVSVPLQGISGFARTNKTIKDVALSADQTTTFYVGDIRVLNDKTPIRAEPNVREINRELGADVIFSATGLGGSSILRYTWDFDASDGIGVDAEGQAVRRKFRKAGTYTITLTVSDYYGLKDPYVTTIKAVINP